jgi:GDPmannose 4,6-dehydratase
MRIEWRGHGVGEQGVDVVTGRTVVKVDARYFRPTEVETLLGDPSKARTKLGWRPEVGFETLVQEMVDSDLQHARRDALMAREGFKTYKYHE